MIPTHIQRRKAPRLKTQLKLQILGLDEDFFVAEGDVSVGGLYIDIARDIGELGSVQRLRLATMRGSEQITLLARIARIATVNDFWRGNVITGVAFQFMFQESTEIGTAVKTIPIERSWAIGEFVRCLARENDGGDARLDHVWQGTLELSDGAAPATVNGVSLQGTVLETEFPVPVGELIRVDIPGPGKEQRIPLYGRAIDSRPFGPGEGKGYRTSVSFEPVELPNARRAGRSIQEAFGALLSTTATGPAAPAQQEPKRQHLAGDLARVSLLSVLTLCELDRATGILRLRAADEEVRCYLSEGRLIDAEQVGGDESKTPEEVLMPVLAWQGGSFELLFEAIEREDRVGKPISVLLMNLMHALDELRRG
ncbi:MAG TPA: DUF4388 domain-containing protein [Polyangiales bacterium]|nr:DUF4388 domain-containing protein [Polyangiales bacterium]